MRCFMLLALAICLQSCAQQKYFIVRHAEKLGVTMASDPPLTEKGRQQAQDLMHALRSQNIQLIFSTNTTRTKATAEPVSKQSGVDVMRYDSDTIQKFTNTLKNIRNRNVLIVGHSNTVDDIVNHLTGKKLMSDLPDAEYGFIYLVKRKGNHFSFEKKAFSSR